MSGGPIWLVLPDGTPKLWAIGTDYDLQKKGLFGSKIEPLLINIIERHFGPGRAILNELKATHVGIKSKRPDTF